MNPEEKTLKYLKVAIFCILCLAILQIANRSHQAQETEELAKQVKKLKDILDGKKTAPPQRYGMVIGVKPEKLDYYKKLHANAWPAVNKQLRNSNIQNYSIYLTQFDDGKWYLFSYFEYIGDDFEGDMKKMGEDEDTVRWWKETDPCQLPFENRKEGEQWKDMEEVYRLK